MKIIAGSIFVLAAAILGAAGVVRSGLGSHDYDLVYMSIGCAFLIGLVGLALVAIGWRDSDGSKD